MPLNKLGIFVLICIVTVLLTVLFVRLIRDPVAEQAIELVKQSEVGTGLAIYKSDPDAPSVQEKLSVRVTTVDKKIRAWLEKRLGPMTVFGWQAQRVPSGHLVSYTFDEGSGPEGYFFEVSSAGIVRVLNGNATLAHMYALAVGTNENYPGKEEPISLFEKYQCLRCLRNVTKDDELAVYGSLRSLIQDKRAVDSPLVTSRNFGTERGGPEQRDTVGEFCKAMLRKPLRSQ